MPDLPIGGGRLYELMRTGRFVLLDATAAHAAATPGRDRVDVVRADRATPYGAAATLLIRPDG
ncbi:hypothetical protein [Nonomuraea diastatica]|uniref:aromatic-ring hydroxylase C-terminal domain-containing protein n=1 Tax=Nonomuraea diastatica TaxID=1848329 RepID=UPI00140E33FC|nr:hypothetical protein [Nonomuraea diastatica]